MIDMDDGKFSVNGHAAFLSRFTGVCPNQTKAMDCHRPTLLFFALHGLSVMKRMDVVESRRGDMEEFLRRLYIVDHQKGTAGFRGGATLIAQCDDADRRQVLERWDALHVTNTYTALACLLMVGNDLSFVDRAAVLRGIAALQQPTGCFIGSPCEPEADLRFVYSACCVCALFDDFSLINVDAMVAHIKQCQSYEGGFGKRPGCEAHGAYTFCAVASLALAGQLDEGRSLGAPERARLLRWLVFKQSDAGLFGRAEKDVDSCYSFWIVAALKLLGADHFVQPLCAARFIGRCENYYGFSRCPSTDTGYSDPDPLHTCLALCGLSMLSSHYNAAAGAADAGDENCGEKPRWYDGGAAAVACRPALQPIHPAMNLIEQLVQQLRRPTDQSAS